jgi:dihydrofolate reductase
VEKVVISSNEEGGDIIVLASASVIRNLLEAGELDRLGITLCPR